MKNPRKPPSQAGGGGKDAASPIPNFDPIPVRARHDGWTPEKQVAFIQALAESGCVVEACRSVGKTKESAYALRRRPEAISFRTAWEAALNYGIRRLSDAAFSRALNGVTVPVFFQGEQIGERRYYDERLTMFLLRYRDPLQYGKCNDRKEYTGHVEGAYLELARALAATIHDAHLPSDQMSQTIGKRLSEIVQAPRPEKPGKVN